MLIISFGLKFISYYQLIIIALRSLIKQSINEIYSYNYVTYVVINNMYLILNDVYAYLKQCQLISFIQIFLFLSFFYISHNTFLYNTIIQYCNETFSAKYNTSLHRFITTINCDNLWHNILHNNTDIVRIIHDDENIANRIRKDVVIRFNDLHREVIVRTRIFRTIRTASICIIVISTAAWLMTAGKLIDDVDKIMRSSLRTSAAK